MLSYLRDLFDFVNAKGNEDIAERFDNYVDHHIVDVESAEGFWFLMWEDAFMELAEKHGQEPYFKDLFLDADEIVRRIKLGEPHIESEAVKACTEDDRYNNAYQAYREADIKAREASKVCRENDGEKLAYKAKTEPDLKESDGYKTYIEAKNKQDRAHKAHVAFMAEVEAYKVKIKADIKKEIEAKIKAGEVDAVDIDFLEREGERQNEDKKLRVK